MSGTAADPRLSRRPAPRRGIRLSWSDPVWRNIVWQVLIVGAVIAMIGYLVGNTARNLENRHIATGFGFLSHNAGIPIGEHLIDYDPATNSYGWAILIGVLNTLKVAVAGVVLEHWVARRRSLNWINLAFFRLNALVSAVFFIVTAAEVIFQGGFHLR